MKSSPVAAAADVPFAMTEILPIGTVVAGYRVDGFLGEGGMGVVYEATQLSLDRKVALKIVAPRFSADSGFRARFRREGLIQARVEHENIVSAYEAGDHDGLLFLAMRLVRGSSLKEVLETRELSAPTALCILRAVADALDSAHEAGLIHRDVKPHNILVGPRDHPYLADFGITKDAGNTGFTRTGQIMGSLDYIAPEQIRGEHVTASCDIYALGAVLFECLAGVVPFVKQSEAALLYAHVAEPPPKISEHHPQLPATLDKVIAWGMAKEPSERPSTATALIEAAEDCLKQGSNPVVGEMTGISQEIPPAVIGSADTRKTPFAVLTDDAADSEPHVEASSAARSVVAEDREEVADPLHPSRDFEGALLLRRRIRPALLGFIAVAMAIVGAGYAIGHSSASGALASSRYTLTAGAASVTPSGNWSRIAVPSVPGLSFRRPAAAHSPTGYVFALGLLSGSEGRSLLPESFEKGLKSKPSPDGVRLGEAAAFRYQNLQVKGSSRPVTLMLVTPGSAALGEVVGKTVTATGL